MRVQPEHFRWLRGPKKEMPEPEVKGARHSSQGHLESSIQWGHHSECWAVGWRTKQSQALACISFTLRMNREPPRGCRTCRAASPDPDLLYLLHSEEMDSKKPGVTAKDGLSKPYL